MSSSALSPAQAAVYAILSTDDTLLSLIDEGGVVDAVTDEMPFSRFVHIDPVDETPDNTFEGYGSDVRLTVNSYVAETGSRSGNLTVQNINNRVVELLDGTELTVEGRQTVFCHFDSSQVLNDDQWRRIATDFRIVTEE